MTDNNWPGFFNHWRLNTNRGGWVAASGNLDSELDALLQRMDIMAVENATPLASAAYAVFHMMDQVLSRAGAGDVHGREYLRSRIEQRIRENYEVRYNVDPFGVLETKITLKTSA